MGPSHPKPDLCCHRGPDRVFIYTIIPFGGIIGEMCTSVAKRRNFLTVGLLGVVCCAMMGSVKPLDAAAIVFSNKTTRPITFVIGDGPNDPSSHKAFQITAGDVLPVPVDGPKTVWFDAKQLQAKKDNHQPNIINAAVAPNSIYAFVGETTLRMKHNFSPPNSK